MVKKKCSKCEVIFDPSCPCQNPFISDQQCPTKTPEPHLLGEFPMSCYNCHIYADS